MDSNKEPTDVDVTADMMVKPMEPSTAKFPSGSIFVEVRVHVMPENVYQQSLSLTFYIVMW